MEKTVLLVEDEPDVVDLLRFHLRRARFKVLVAPTGAEGLASIRSERPDLVILDIMLPGMSGIEVCRALRTDPQTATIPVLMLTAKGEAADRVKGLETGADDYVTKPFSPKEVVLRAQGLLRRQQSASEQASLVDFDGISLDKDNLVARVDGERMELTTTEFRLLTAFINNRSKTLTRDMLLRDVWGYSSAADSRTVDTHMRRLREKLGSHAHRLETIRGEGYRLKPKPGGPE